MLPGNRCGGYRGAGQATATVASTTDNGKKRGRERESMSLPEAFGKVRIPPVWCAAGPTMEARSSRCPGFTALMSPALGEPPDLPHDERLARALEDALRRQAAGEPVDLDTLGKEQPDLVEELRQLLAVGQVLDFAQASDPRRTLPQTTAGDSGALPRTLGDYELIEELG